MGLRDLKSRVVKSTTRKPATALGIATGNLKSGKVECVRSYVLAGNHGVDRLKRTLKLPQPGKGSALTYNLSLHGVDDGQADCT